MMVAQMQATELNLLPNADSYNISHKTQTVGISYEVFTYVYIYPVLVYWVTSKLEE